MNDSARPNGFSCIACHGTDAVSLYPVVDSNEDCPGRWEIRQCRRCGLGMLDPFPDARETAGFYEHVFYDGQGKRFNPVVEWLRKQLASRRTTMLNRLCPGRGRLLDFGSGPGHFAAVQRQNGWEVHDLDPYSASSQYGGKAATRPDGGVSLDYPDDSFDAVSLWYVIEHLANPVAVLAELDRVLKPGGVLLLATQNFASPQARAFGPRWLILDPPRHLWQFSPRNLDLLLSRLGYVPRARSFASLELGPFTILQSLLNTLLGNRNYLFRGLKSGKTPRKLPLHDKAMAVVSALLAIPLAPISLLAYCVLLPAKAGDIFTVCYQRGPYAAQ